MTEKGYRIFVIGAGFSRPAGLPLGNELFAEVKRRAISEFGSDNWLSADLAEFIEYKSRCEGVSLKGKDVDFEEFLSFFDVEHFLGLRGSDTWSTEGNESQILVKRFIGKIIHEQTPPITNLPEFYFRFAELLKASDIIITFNYDVLLERSLEHIGKPYRLFPQRFKTIGRTMNTIDSAHAEVIILKMHGSVDWFDRSRYEETEKTYRLQGFDLRPHDPVFEDHSRYALKPVLEGPQNPDNPLRSMFRMRRLDLFYSRSYPPSTPWILSPSHSKILYSPALHEFWHGMNEAGVWNLGAGIIGFSMPLHDEYVRQVIYRLVVNYQEVNQDLSSFNVKKSNLKMIDFRSDDHSLRELRDRYRFIDWSRTDLYVRGFNAESVQMLFE